MLVNSPKSSYFEVFAIPIAGVIPPELGNLGTLQQLILSDNRLSGE